MYKGRGVVVGRLETSLVQVEEGFLNTGKLLGLFEQGTNLS